MEPKIFNPNVSSQNFEVAEKIPTGVTITPDEWCYSGRSGHSNFSSEWCYSGQNVGLIKPQHVGVIVTPYSELRIYSFFYLVLNKYKIRITRICRSLLGLKEGVRNLLAMNFRGHILNLPISILINIYSVRRRWTLENCKVTSREFTEMFQRLR